MYDVLLNLVDFNIMSCHLWVHGCMSFIFINMDPSDG